MTVYLQGDCEAIPGGQEKFAEDGTHQPEDVKIIEEKNEETSTVQ